LTAVVDLPTPPLPEATAMMCRCRRRWRGALRRHHGGGRQDTGHRPDRLLASQAQRFERGAPRRVDLEGDGDMAGSRRDAAHHAERGDAATRHRIDHGIENLADGRFADSRHVLLLPLRRIFACAA
jgi:hypothetical protein